MSTVLIYRRATCVTGRAIAKAVGLPRENYGMMTGRPSGRALMQADTVIRWGTRIDIPSGLRVINEGHALGVSGDKIATFQRLGEAGIPIPEWTINMDEADEWSRSGLVFARMRRGSNGRDIQMHTHNQQVHTHDFYCKVVPVRREYRVHVVNGNVIRYQGRYLDHPERAGDGLVRSHRNGWCFRAPRREINSSRQEVAVNAIKAVGLDFGMVDLAVTDDGNGWERGDTVVFEVGGAPGCSPLTISKYAEAFQAAGWIT